MQMYNLIEFCNNYSKNLGRLKQYYRDEQSLNDNGVFLVPVLHLNSNINNR